MKANKNTLQIGIPYVFEYEGNRIDNYPMCTELHELHGWVDYVVPVIGENQRLSSAFYDEENNIVTHTIENFTQEEIDTEYRASIPQIVTPRQLKTQLVLSGINLSDIDALISQLDEPQKTITKIAWEYSTDFDRNNPMILAFAPMLNLTETDVDNIFIAASQL